MTETERRRPTRLLLAFLLGVLALGVVVFVWFADHWLSEDEGAGRHAAETPQDPDVSTAAYPLRTDAEGRSGATLAGTGGRRSEEGEANTSGLQPLPGTRNEAEVITGGLDLETVDLSEIVIPASSDAAGGSGDSPGTPEPIRRVGDMARWMDDEPVYTVAFTPDARLALSAGESSVIYVREVDTGRIVARLLGHGSGGVSDLEVDVTGSRVLSGGYDKTARLWDLGSRALIRVLEPGGGTIYHAAFDAAGRRGVTAGDMDEVLVWDLDTGDVLKRFSLKGYVDGAGMSRDGRHIAGVNDGGELRMWDYATGDVLLDVKAHSGAAGEVIFLEDTNQLLTCGEDGKIKIWERDDGKLVREWKAHDARISEVAVSPDGRTVATGGWKGYVRHWRIDTGAQIWDNFGHRDLVVAMAFTGDGRYVASGARDGATRLWDALTGEPIRMREDPSEGHAGAVNDLLYAGGQLVSAGADGTIRLWNAEGTAWVRLLESKDAGANCLALHPDGTRLVVGASDGTIRIWDLVTGRELRLIAAHERAIADVVLVDGGHTILTTSEDGAFRCTDLEAGRFIDRRQPESRYIHLAVSPDAQSVAALRLDGLIDFVTPAGVLDRTLEVDAPMGEAFLTWFPDGRTMLVPASPGALRFDAWSGERIRAYRDGGNATSCAVTPDGRGLLFVFRGSDVHLHDAFTGKRRRVVGRHKGEAMCLAVSPSGHVVATGGKDGAIYLWPVSD